VDGIAVAGHDRVSAMGCHFALLRLAVPGASPTAVMTSATRHAHQRPLRQWRYPHGFLLSSGVINARWVPRVAAVLPQRGPMEVPTSRDESAQPMSTVPRTRMKTVARPGWSLVRFRSELLM
jgi:hypothetical protein